jgi:hypothetical protein
MAGTLQDSCGKCPSIHGRLARFQILKSAFSVAKNTSLTGFCGPVESPIRPIQQVAGMHCFVGQIPPKSSKLPHVQHPNVDASIRLKNLIFSGA